MECVINLKNMRIKIVIFSICLSILFGCNNAELNDKKMLKNFANAILNKNIPCDLIIDTYLDCPIKAKALAVQYLEYYRAFYTKRQNRIKVYTYKEAIANKKGFEFPIKNSDRVYFISFNDADFEMPILLNAKGKIIAFVALNKGNNSGFFIGINEEKE